MSHTTTQPDSAWGLELASNAIRLAHVYKAGQNYRLDSFHEIELSDSVDAAQAVEQLARLSDIAATNGHSPQPLVICLPDDQVLHRRLHLPSADEASMDKMVTAQMEVLLPGQSQQFNWSWDHAAQRNGLHTSQASEGSDVWLFAAREQAIRNAAQTAAPLGAHQQTVIPSAIALSRAYWQLVKDTRRCSALIIVAARSTSVLMMRDQSLLACALVDEGYDDWTTHLAEQLQIDLADARAVLRQPEASCEPGLVAAVDELLDDWSRQLREVYNDVVSELAEADRPQRCHWFADTSLSPQATAWLARSIPVPVDPMDTTAVPWQDGKRAQPQAVAAIGAALSVLEPSRPQINLAQPRDVAAKAIPHLRRRVMAVLWLIAAIGGLYLVDVNRAAWLNDALSPGAIAPEQRQQLERQLAMARYLERSGPTPLAMLDEVSSLAPKTLILTSWDYQRSGQVTLRGSTPNRNDVQTFLQNLSEARLFATVKLQNQKQVDKKVEFEITAQPVTWYAPPSPPPAPEAEAEDAVEDTAQDTQASDEKDTEDDPETPPDKTPPDEKADDAPPQEQGP